MKLKLDFISNSSSAAFTILKKNLTKEQIVMIYNHIEFAYIIDEKKYNKPTLTKYIGRHDQWNILEREKNGQEYIRGYTSMDNFNMREFLKEIGIESQYINYEKHI